ncbi:MAG: hypothetical protein ACR2OC_07305 [Solirubrobacterales bacterium]
MKTSDNVVEETWLAYAFERSTALEQIGRRLDRVGAHYDALLADPPVRRQSIGEREGLVLWQREDDRLRWPLWSEQDGVVAAATGAPVGWERITGALPVERAAAELARALDSRPRAASELNAPFVIGVRNEAAGQLRIVNDALGIGRLYEIELDGGWAWSNRLGALPIFAGTKPRADGRGWGILAAAGWFLADSTPIARTRKVGPGTVIEVTATAEGIRVERSETGTRESVLVAPRGRPSGAAGDAAEHVRGLAEALGLVWGVEPVIDLTGGRDSRVSAAGAVSAGIAARFKTVDNEPGEVDVVRELVAAAPRPLEHVVNQPEAEEALDDLETRLAAIHLVHDGMRNPQEVRRPTALPHEGFVPPSISGHGGEIGHGFYYANRRTLFQLRRGGLDGLRKKLITAARRRHSSARPEGYEAYAEVCDRVLEAGRGAGLDGAELLDYFYLAERLPYRSGLGARSGRYSACVVPNFVRAAFDLKPAERLQAKLHEDVVAELVPEWGRVGFFASGSGPMPAIRRARIWEKEEHAAEITRMIDSERGWPEMFDPDRIRAMWSEIREGGGSADYEHVFYRLAWRVGYEDHLDRLAEAATT